ncbi:hypothetical protein CEXT_735001 [Caerostris extrusa]|uniref:Uncharacterized protein n=1 Tax=Caerostris extrusa TaxID=172846 RepID=A0AAV4MK63_CAEEX|nr:hypothetical protein CEXT_735001 [Caerostris extrusa]
MFRSRLFIVATSNGAAHMVAKHDVRIVTGNRFPSFQTQQELLQSMNKGPPLSVSERTLQQKLHAMEIWSRILCKWPFLLQSYKDKHLQWAKIAECAL